VQQGQPVRDSIISACRVRLRPILMTSLATIIGLLPMALKLRTGSEQYAPLARAIIAGLATSVLFTVYIVPAACQARSRTVRPDCPLSSARRPEV
jgi:hydrophobic/amphiphilic exporter-1 (mainly G- bacteria), HAE1 family